MATPIAKNASLVAVMAEVTEGTYVPPAAATDFVQTLSGIEINPAKELVEREVLSDSIGQVQPRVGLRSVSGALPVEFKGSGVEGGDPEYSLLIKSALGAATSITTNTTTKTGNSGTVLQIQDADIGKFAKFNVLVIKQSGAHHICYVTAIVTTLGSATLTIAPAKPSGSFSDNVVISKNQMYHTANTGHPALSVSTYWADEILQTAIGAKVSSLALSNFQTGQVANWDVGFDGLNYARSNASAAFSPSYDTALPPIIVTTACVTQDGTHLELNSFGVEVSNDVSFVESICDGRTSSRMTKRTIKGSMNPYMDDATFAQFTKFDNNTSFTLFAYAANPSTVTGEIEMGSVCAIVLPNCIITEIPTGDLNGLLVDNISFSANRGSTGIVEEMYVGFV